MTEEKHDTKIYFIYLFNMATGNIKFPWLDQKYVLEIEQRTANAPAWAKELLEQQMYSDFYAQQKREEEQAERLSLKNQIASLQLDPSANTSWSRIQLKKWNLADVIRNYYGMNIADWDDDAVVGKFTSSIKDWDKMYVDNNDIMVKTGLFWDKWKQLNEQQEVKMNPNVSNAVTQAQEKQAQANLSSTSHFDDPEYAKYYLDNIDEEYKPFVKAAREAGYEDWIIASLADAKKTYDDFQDRGFWDKAEEVNVGTFQWFVNFFGNAYNNLAGNNPYVWVAPKLNMQSIQFKDDLLGAWNNYWDLRAESWWTKWGEIFGDLLANTAVMMLLPWFWESAGIESISESALKNWTKWVLRNVSQRMTYWGLEWAVFGGMATMGQEDANLDKLQNNMVAWGTIWSVFWLWWAWANAWKYRNILKTSLKEWSKSNTVKNLLDMYDRWVKPTSRWMKSNTQLQQYNDDTLGAVETIIKNKEWLKYIDANWEETFGHLPRNLDEFSQAIKQTKQSIYNDYTAIAREAGKETSVDTSNIVKDLKSQLKNKEWTAWWDEGTKARIEKWIKDLEELDNKMSVEWTQNKIQELNQKIQTFIKNWNPNDVGTNAVDSWVLNGLKSSLDDAIENAWLDSDTYFALRNAYKELRAIESDVNHRTIVYGRQNPESLVDSLANLSSIDAIAKFLKNPKEWALKFAWSQLEKISAKNRNNPNNLIKKMFNEADDTISKSETLKTQAQLAWERTQKQQYSIRKSRQQRMDERAARYQKRESARQALYEKQAQQEQAYQDYLRSKWVWSDTQALPEWQQTTNYNTIISNDPNPITTTPEWVSIRQGQVAEINQPSTRTRKYVVDNVEKYKQSKVEYDNFIDDMASDIGGTPIKAPLKILNPDWSLRENWISRVLEKAADRPNWVDWVTDIVRGTVAVEDQAWMQKAIDWMNSKGIQFDDKFTTPTELWYKDLSFLKETKNWVKAEVQINTPEMLVAKEWEWALKMWVVDQAWYDAIVEKAGVEWGKWHKYYEEWREIREWVRNWSIDPVEWQTRMDKIAQESRDYYSKFDNLWKKSWNVKIPEYNWIAKEIVDNGWITLDVLKKRNLWGEPYVAVSPYPNRSKIIKVSDFNDEAVAEYFEANADKLFEDWYALWGWVNDWNVYLDVSIALPKEMQNEAVEIANKYNQKAIFDLETFEDIPTAWNGEYMDVDEAEISKYIKSLFNKKK